MAVSKKLGEDNSGEYVYKKDEKGRKILDQDLDVITEAFIQFVKE